MGKMNKLSEDGKVAVLYSPGFGAGWYTWNYEYPEILFDPAIVKFIEKEQFDELVTYVTLKYPDIYTGGMKDLKVEWIPEGTLFKVNEYDGSESIEYKENDQWMVA
jgi:hypothetical protein